MPPEIIDTHNHVISSDTARFPLAPVGGKQSDWSATRPVSHDQMIADMDAAGVAKSVVVQASTAYGHDNSYLAEAVAAHPTRLTGVFSVDILAPDACERIRSWAGQGLVGFRLFTTGSTMPGQASWLDDPRCHPAWALAEDVSWPSAETTASIPRDSLPTRPATETLISSEATFGTTCKVSMLVVSGTGSSQTVCQMPELAV